MDQYEKVGHNKYCYEFHLSEAIKELQKVRTCFYTMFEEAGISVEGNNLEIYRYLLDVGNELAKLETQSVDAICDWMMENYSL